MNWLSNFIRPKIQSFVGQKDVPDNLWTKCPSCEAMLFQRDLDANMNVCTKCNHHLRIGVKQRLDIMFDNASWHEVPVPSVPVDPLKFRDKKRYSDRLRDSQAKTGRKDAIVVAKGNINGNKAVVAAFDFDFMGGSMGAGVGEGLVKAGEVAVVEKAALIAVPASGGARMQEGAISLMQMPRTMIAVEMVKAEKLPYIVLLTDPTTGGVSASFAMVGDIHIAEPGAVIGFAGKRVIEETIREQLPDGFQTAEYLMDHGMVDLVVPRSELREKLGTLLTILMKAGKDASRKGRPETMSAADAKGAKMSGTVQAAGTVASLDAYRKPDDNTIMKGKKVGR